MRLACATMLSSAARMMARLVRLAAIRIDVELGRCTRASGCLALSIWQPLPKEKMRQFFFAVVGWRELNTRSIRCPKS